jgi:hypothetical protein
MWLGLWASASASCLVLRFCCLSELLQAFEFAVFVSMALLHCGFALCYVMWHSCIHSYLMHVCEDISGCHRWSMAAMCPRR